MSIPLVQPAIPPSDIASGTLDSLVAHVAVLDEHGVIVLTNASWKQFATENGGVSTLAGDYLAICDAAVEDPYAEAAARGIRAILSGERRRFDLAEDRPDRLNPPNGVWSLCGVGSKLK